jgi:glutaredoxin
MDFLVPYSHTYTIYTKSACYYCEKLKNLLEDNNITYIVINCDNYLQNNRDNFIEFIKKITKTNWKTFPIVFHNENFIGGFNDTQNYINTSRDLEFSIMF